MDARRSEASAAGIAPSERIDLGDIVVRRWEPGDLTARFEAIATSYPAIHPWMEWLPEPATIEQQRAFGETVAAGWPDAEGNCHYGIFDDSGAVVGAVGLHDFGQPALAIGYWCHVEYTGRGYITRSASRLTDIALSLPCVERVEIHCDEANLRSAAVARRVGYHITADTSFPRIGPCRTASGARAGRVRPGNGVDQGLEQLGVGLNLAAIAISSGSPVRVSVVAAPAPPGSTEMRVGLRGGRQVEPEPSRGSGERADGLPRHAPCTEDNP